MSIKNASKECKNDCPCGKNCQNGCTGCSNPICDDYQTPQPTESPPTMGVISKYYFSIIGIIKIMVFPENIRKSYMFNANNHSLTPVSIDSPSDSFVKNAAYAVVNNMLHIFGGSEGYSRVAYWLFFSLYGSYLRYYD